MITQSVSDDEETADIEINSATPDFEKASEFLTEQVGVSINQDCVRMLWAKHFVPRQERPVDKNIVGKNLVVQQKNPAEISNLTDQEGQSNRITNAPEHGRRRNSMPELTHGNHEPISSERQPNSQTELTGLTHGSIASGRQQNSRPELTGITHGSIASGRQPNSLSESTGRNDGSIASGRQPQTMHELPGRSYGSITKQNGDAYRGSVQPRQPIIPLGVVDYMEEDDDDSQSCDNDNEEDGNETTTSPPLLDDMECQHNSKDTQEETDRNTEIEQDLGGVQTYDEEQERRERSNGALQNSGSTMERSTNDAPSESIEIRNESNNGVHLETSGNNEKDKNNVEANSIEEVDASSNGALLSGGNPIVPLETQNPSVLGNGGLRDNQKECKKNAISKQNNEMVRHVSHVIAVLLSYTGFILMNGSFPFLFLYRVRRKKMMSVKRNQ